MGHEQLVRRIFDEIINDGNIDAADELMTADFVDHGPTGGIEGVAAFKELVRHPVVTLVPREEAS